MEKLGSKVRLGGRIIRTLAASSRRRPRPVRQRGDRGIVLNQRRSLGLDPERFKSGPTVMYASTHEMPHYPGAGSIGGAASAIRSSTLPCAPATAAKPSAT
jgi:hypothetical protein